MPNKLSIKSDESIKSNKYEIYFFQETSEKSSNLLSSFIKKKNYESVFILVDEFVSKKHLSPILEVLKKNSIEVNYFSIFSSEKNKNLQTCQLIYEKMLNLNLGRKTLFINFGGGIVSDLGGFVASTYKRGIDFINIPTTLLAMVDASIGGKVGIDFANNKNSIGLFANPKLVLINLEYLETLPKREVLNGFAEVIKYGLIYDRKFFDFIFKNKISAFSKRDLMKIVQKSCEIKYFYVKGDERDLGKRQLLNFGHTVGHALESYFLSSKQALKHGEAILWGMLIESRIANLSGFLTNKEYEIIKQKIETFGLVKIDFKNLDLDKLRGFISNDKKNQNKKIIFNLIKKIAKVEYGQTLNLSVLTDVLKTF